MIPEPKNNQVAEKRIYMSIVLTSALDWNGRKKELVKLNALKMKEENKKKELKTSEIW